MNVFATMERLTNEAVVLVQENGFFVCAVFLLFLAVKSYVGPRLHAANEARKIAAASDPEKFREQRERQRQVRLAQQSRISEQARIHRAAERSRREEKKVKRAATSIRGYNPLDGDRSSGDRSSLRRVGRRPPGGGGG